ncbi:MAG TPA: efflux RND transporter periplasmic adaptor subunit [Pyrinomonadaceae bacterium]|nr:efflux RND transporter periplasmic adaptor subunit [Pyrinomonadaceae bacterium]
MRLSVGPKAFSRLAFFFVLLILATTSTCSWRSAGGNRNSNRGGGPNANANSDQQEAVIPVTLGKSENRPVAATIQATGSLSAQETSDIAPKVAGKVANVYANVGQFVSAGAVIAKLDDTDARQRLATARAGVAQQQAAVRQAEARLGLGPNSKFEASAIPEVRAASSNYQQMLAQLRQAEANEKRYRELIESGDVAMMTYEQYRTARDTAQAQANAAHDQLETAINTARQNNQAIAAAQAELQAAQANVTIAQQAITDTLIHAPFAGYISSRPVAVGEFVSTASVVATLLRTNPIKIVINVAEADVPYVVVGHGVTLQVDAYPNRNFAGYVSAVNPQVDPTSRAASVEALIDNGDNLLKAGMFATVRIIREGGSTAVFVPKASVYNDRATQSYRVFEIQNNVAKLDVVQLGAEEGDAIEILSGIDPGKDVATSNVEQLYEGAKVAPQ